jgi:hypothetical protein
VAISANQSITCVICTDRRTARNQPPRHPARGNVCNACRTALHTAITEIPDLIAELAADDEPQPATWEHIDQQGRRSTGGPDPVNAAIPAGPTRPIKLDAAVSGSRDAPAPTNLDYLDLTAPPRQHPAIALTTAGRTSGDQIGSIGAATELDFWVTDLIGCRGRGEHRPNPTVRDLCDWLTTGGQQSRLMDACDAYPAIDEMASSLHRVRSNLRTAAGRVDRPERKTGIPCRSCDAMSSLFSTPGDEWIECGCCGTLMGDDEYTTWIGLLASSIRSAAST